MVLKYAGWVVLRGQWSSLLTVELAYRASSYTRLHWITEALLWEGAAGRPVSYRVLGSRQAVCILGPPLPPTTSVRALPRLSQICLHLNWKSRTRLCLESLLAIDFFFSLHLFPLYMIFLSVFLNTFPRRQKKHIKCLLGLVGRINLVSDLASF